MLACILVLLGAANLVSPAGAAPAGAAPAGAAPAAGIAAPAAAPKPLAPVPAAAAAIDAARATVVAVAAKIGRMAGPFETDTLLDRAKGARDEAQHAVAVLAAALGDGSLTAAQRPAIVDQIARGGRVVTAARQLVARIRASPGEQVERTVAIRTPSPLSLRFWGAVLAALPRDLDRIGALFAAQAAVTWRGMTTAGIVPAALGLIAAALLVMPARLALRRAGRRFMIDRIPQSRLRRSGWALWIALLGGALPLIAILLLRGGFSLGGLVSAPWQPLADSVIRAVGVSAAVYAVAGAILQRSQPSWRLIAVSDRTADEVRPWTIAASIAIFATIVIDGAAAAAGLSGAARSAAEVAETLLHSAVSAMLLLAIGNARRRADEAADAANEAAPPPADRPEGGGGDDGRRGLVAVALAGLLGWVAVAATLVALAMGYVPFALLIARLLVWLPLVGGCLYLTWLVVDDVATELVSGDASLGQSLHRAFGVRKSAVDQVGVSLSALLRILLLLVAGIAVMEPFGGNWNQLGLLAAAVGRGVTVGQITIAPGAIVRGLIVLAVALFVVRAAERWLAESYLPKTELDEGAQNSIRTVSRYLGFTLAISWALAALGIGFERIALMLSALSVGIGFGLQAITQNFVSGLILLIERPVKIGDMVEVGGQKGDVKRINVRATEIETVDRSTLIIPNSELITKTVRNITHSDSLGLVQIKFTVPLETDVEAVKALVLSLFKEAGSVFDTPEPKVMIDSIDDGVVHLVCSAYCSSPRTAYSTRSEVLFRLITELRARGIAIGSPPLVPTVGGGGPAPGSAGVIGGD